MLLIVVKHIAELMKDLIVSQLYYTSRPIRYRLYPTGTDEDQHEENKVQYSNDRWYHSSQ